MKAQISINFTWLFGVIAGILVFIFLINFMTSEKEGSGDFSNLVVLENLEVGLKAVANTPNTFTKIQTPMMELRVLCDEMDSSGLTIRGASNVKPKVYEAIFSPEEMKGDHYFAWTQDFLLPNMVDRFLYLSNKDTLFVLVKDSAGLWTDFMEKLPADFPRTVLNLSEALNLGNIGYENYHIIFFDKAEAEITKEFWDLDGEIKGISIIPQTENSGALTFYEFADDKFSLVNSSFYITSSLMYGAVFSGSNSHYTCNLDKALFRLKLISELNKKRAEKIMMTLAGSAPICQDLARGIEKDGSLSCNECLRVMKDLPALYDQMTEGANSENGLLISGASSQISGIMRDLAKGRNCPTI